MRTARGFTLIELLVTVAVLAVLLAVSAPAMHDMLLNNRMSAMSNDLLSDLAAARSEALRRGQRVVICKNSGTDAACGTGAWADGWLLYLDADNDSVLDAGETIFRVRQSVANHFTVNSTGITDLLVVRPVGLVTPVGSFKVCDQRTGAYGRTITISAAGRASVSVATCP